MSIDVSTWLCGPNNAMRVLNVFRRGKASANANPATETGS